MTNFDYSPIDNVRGDRLAAAVLAIYTSLGVAIPDTRSNFEAVLAAAPSTVALVQELCTLAAKADDPAAFWAEAVPRLQQAKATDDLRGMLERNRSSVETAEASAVLARAKTDLATKFQQAVKMLTEAAKTLDPARPLDREVAFSQHTTAAYEAATVALSTLGRLASLTPASRAVLDAYSDPGRVYAAARSVASILTTPKVGFTSKDGKPTTTVDPWSKPLPGNATVRALCEAVAADPDAALIAVARGEYLGVTFKWADSAAHFATGLQQVPQYGTSSIIN